ncbi:MAG: AAA family ATPase [Bacteroidota bacterium]
MDRLYIAATSQHVGKTTSTLGLMAAIKELGINVGYCKPVGQQFVDLGELKVDKDALLFARSNNFELKAEWHSPVIIGRGVTSKYLEDPSQFDFPSSIQKASRHLQSTYDTIVYEGTGHPGVGSVCDVSNAQVAQLLSAPVVMVVEGGIGKTIDMLNMNLALFRERRVPVRGVILNKVLPKKIDKVRKYVGKYLDKIGIPLLGVLPYDRSLSSPIMATIRHAVKGVTLINKDRLDNRAENIASGVLLQQQEVRAQPNSVIVTGWSRLESTLENIAEQIEQKKLPEDILSGVVVTVREHEMLKSELEEIIPHREFLDRHRIPLIVTDMDSYAAAVKINRMEVKINLRTPWKIRRAIELVKEHVDLSSLFG